MPAHDSREVENQTEESTIARCFRLKHSSRQLPNGRRLPSSCLVDHVPVGLQTVQTLASPTVPCKPPGGGTPTYRSENITASPCGKRRLADSTETRATENGRLFQDDSWSGEAATRSRMSPGPWARNHGPGLMLRRCASCREVVEKDSNWTAPFWGLP